MQAWYTERTKQIGFHGGVYPDLISFLPDSTKHRLHYLFGRRNIFQYRISIMIKPAIPVGKQGLKIFLIAQGGAIKIGSQSLQIVHLLPVSVTRRERKGLPLCPVEKNYPNRLL